jgi:hypothetical protein
MALTHEGPLIAAAINRYFGYVLVGAVRLSAEPFIPRSIEAGDARPQANAAVRAEVEATLTPVADEGVKEALRQLGLAIIGKPKK